MLVAKRTEKNDEWWMNDEQRHFHGEDHLLQRARKKAAVGTTLDSKLKILWMLKMIDMVVFYIQPTWN